MAESYQQVTGIELAGGLSPDPSEHVPTSQKPQAQLVHLLAVTPQGLNCSLTHLGLVSPGIFGL